VTLNGSVEVAASLQTGNVFGAMKDSRRFAELSDI